jgi:hypothetical protein
MTTMNVNLSTVQSAASWAGVTLPSPDPSNVAGNMALCLTAASVEFLRLTGRGPMNFSVPFNSPYAQPVDYVETYNGNGNAEIYLRNFPINTISSVTVSGQAIQASTGAGSAGYGIGNSGRSIVVLTGAGNAPDTFYTYPYGVGGWPRYGFPRGLSNIQVSYNAGFATQTLVDLDTIPTTGTPIVQVQSLLTGAAWLADEGVTYFVGGGALTPSLTAPAVGQYYVQGNGFYLFNAGDAGKQVVISYTAAGTPSDIIQTVNQMVALNYKRRNWIGQRSVAMKDVGSTSYTLLLDPEILRVVNYYKRRSVGN